MSNAGVAEPSGIKPGHGPDVSVSRSNLDRVVVMLHTPAARKWWDKTLPLLIPTHLVMEYNTWYKKRRHMVVVERNSE